MAKLHRKMRNIRERYLRIGERHAPKIELANLKLSAISCRNGRILTVKCQTTGQEAIGTDAENLYGREITEFLSSAEGLALNRSFVRIQDPDIRRKVVGLVKVLASTEFDQENSEDSAATPA